MHESRSHTFPPYFMPVALAWALGVMPLACGVTARLNSQAVAKAAQEQQVAEAVETKALEAVPQFQEVHFKRLNFDVVVDGSPLTGKRLRKKLRSFRRTIQAFEESGQRIGVVIIDMGSGASVCYGADELFYPASSIKGPHLISVYDQLVETGQVPVEEVNALAEPIVRYSDNDAYSALCRQYGNQVFADWAVACGAVDEGDSTYQRMLEANYPLITTRQLARMWKRGFAYLDEHSEGAQALTSYLGQRVESPIRAGLGEADLTLTKAGWYPSFDGGGSAPSTCDAGIVLDNNHAYLVALMTDAPADLEWLAELVPGVCSARAVLP